MDETQRDKLLQFLLAMATTAAVLWVEAPEWQRKQTMMAVMRLTARLAGRPHRAAGRAGIAAEHKGKCEEAGALPYSLARLVGQLREYATRTYEQMGA